MEPVIRREYEPKEGFKRIAFGGFAFEKYKKGERVEANVQAAYNLSKVLEKYPEFTKDEKRDILTEFTNFPNIETLNLECIASCLNFLKIYPNPTPEDFRDDVIVDYFTRLFPDKQEDRKIYTIRLKAEFLKYIIAIKSFRSNVESGEREEVEPEEEEE